MKKMQKSEKMAFFFHFFAKKFGYLKNLYIL